jgi:hypothetical protein
MSPQTPPERTHELERIQLLTPLQHHSELAALLADLEPVPDTRSMRWGDTDIPIRRPYTDLAYG